MILLNKKYDIWKKMYMYKIYLLLKELNCSLDILWFFSKQQSIHMKICFIIEKKTSLIWLNSQFSPLKCEL